LKYIFRFILYEIDHFDSSLSGGVPLPGQEKLHVITSAELLENQVATSPNAESVPAWIAFDRKVLRFYGYFQEAVQERREEKYRIRKYVGLGIFSKIRTFITNISDLRVNIYFYLEDDTVQVIEPRTPNSGIPQGTLIRRHRIPGPGNGPFSRQSYLFSDLSVGKEVTFYARTFKIVGCDHFTRVCILRALFLDNDLINLLASRHSLIVSFHGILPLRISLKN
jgi:hypothetical protein